MKLGAGLCIAEMRITATHGGRSGQQKASECGGEAILVFRLSYCLGPQLIVAFHEEASSLAHMHF